MSTLATYPRITPFLWFNANAEEAVNSYLSIFDNSRRLNEVRSPSTSPGSEGSVIIIGFELDGQRFTALNGGPQFKFTEAISLLVRCESQQEVDHYWTRLSDGGNEGQCGWLKDRFGVSWQVVPSRLPDLIKDQRAMNAMLGMKKLDIGELERAASS